MPDRDTYRTLLVDAFAEQPLAGIPIGVVPDADGLSTQQMRAITAELGAIRTAFVQSAAESTGRLRVFSPADACKRCDEAILAAYAQLHADGAVEDGDYTVDTADARVGVEVDPDGTVWTAQSIDDVQTVEVEYDRVGAALGIDPATLRDVGADLPAAIASTGTPFLLVPVNFLSALTGASPDGDAVAALAAAHDVAGIYAYTFDTLSAEATLHARAFVPGRAADSADVSPIPPGTAMAAGACGGYLQRAEAFDEPPEEFVIEQGHFQERPSRIRVRVGDTVHVGGRAVTSLDGTLVVPVSDDDGILEA